MSMSGDCEEWREVEIYGAVDLLNRAIVSQFFDSCTVFQSMRGRLHTSECIDEAAPSIANEMICHGSIAVISIGLRK